MDIELLRTFLEVNRTRHFGRAAQNLFITQSAVSARIRQLEETLGVPVLTRERNNIRLTPAGQRLLPHADKVVSTWARARQVISMGEGPDSALTIGATAGVWEAGLRASVNLLCRSLADTRLSLESHDSETLLRRLLDRSMDVALMFQPPRLSGMVTRPVSSVELVMVASRPALSLAEALNGGYVAVDWPGLQIAQLSPENEAPPLPVLRFSLAGMARDYLLSAGGSAYLAAATIAADIAAGRLHEVADAPRIQRQFYAVFAQDSEREGLIEKVIGVLAASRDCDAG